MEQGLELALMEFVRGVQVKMSERGYVVDFLVSIV
jgi:hypothetical protein